MLLKTAYESWSQMRIVIGQRYKPFSHIPGEAFVLPGSAFGFQIYPTLIKVYDLTLARPLLISELALDITGPALDFTIQQDLERGEIKVWGRYKEGYLRYLISPINNGKEFALTLEKGPPKFTLNSNFFEKSNVYQTKEMNRLSLGSHRAQDWELIKRKGDLVDILPLWSKLGNWIPQTPFEGWEGTLILLKKCKEAIESKEKTILYNLFLDLFRAAFQGGLYPCLEDLCFQGYGITPPSREFTGSSLFLLSEGAKAIQNLFISIQSREIVFLELLPPQFHCGRFVGIDCEHLGTLSMEWSKKTIRRLIFHSTNESEVFFRFQHGLKRFRLRTNNKDRGRFIDVGTPLKLECNVLYFLDNFQG